MGAFHSHGGAGASRSTPSRLGATEDRCEVHVDARLAHPHGPDACAHAGDGRIEDRRRLVISMVLTASILVAEVVGGLMSGSLALLSDAGHVLTDLSALILSLLALLFAARPADARRSFGFYRLEILAALANGLTLLALAGIVVWKAWGRLGDPPEVHTGIMLVFAVGGLIVNLIAARLLHGAHTLNVRAAYMHIVSDLLASVAVVAGGIVMAIWSGMWIIDPILSILIALAVVWGGIRLVREAIDVLLETVPRGVDMERLRADVGALEGIEDVHDVHVWTISSGIAALSAHIVVKAGTSAVANDDVLRRVKEVLLRQHNISHSTLQIESDEYEHVGHVH